MKNMKHSDSRSRLIRHALPFLLAFGASHAAAQAIERVKAGDAELDCAAIASEGQAMDGLIAAGATTEKNAGSGSGGLFGALGAMVSKAAQQPAGEKALPDAAAQEKAAQAQARKSFLVRLGSAKECQPGGQGGKQLSAEQFQQIANNAPAPLTLAAIQPALDAPVTLLPADGLVDGKLDMKGKRFYIAEFRVLFDVGGQVSANTRGSYLPGRDYGSTRAKVNYTVPQIDVAAFQAITDKAWEDFKARLAAAGVKVEDREAFEREHGAIYEATEEASKPGKPVFIDKNYGHSERKFLVMAPAGMKLHSRGFAGLGAGNIGKRIEWSKSNLEALSISVAVNIAALESSGSGMTMIKRESSASAGEGMSISMAPDTLLVQSHAHTNILRMNGPLAVDGSFASFREVGGYDTDKDAVGRTMGLLTNLAGMGANKTKRTDTEVDIDGPAMGRMALQGLATINQAIADRIRAGL